MKGFTLTPAQASLLARLVDGWTLTCHIYKFKRKAPAWIVSRGIERESLNPQPCRNLLVRKLIVPAGENYKLMGGMAQDFTAVPAAMDGRDARLSGESISCPYDALSEPGAVIAWHTAYQLPGTKRRSPMPKNSQQKAYATNSLNQHYDPARRTPEERMAITLGNIRAIWFTDQFINNYEHLTGANDLRTVRIFLGQAIDRLKLLL